MSQFRFLLLKPILIENLVSTLTATHEKFRHDRKFREANCMNMSSRLVPLNDTEADHVTKGYTRCKVSNNSIKYVMSL